MVFVPYIYTRAEIRSLLRTTRISQKGSHFISSETLRTILLTLYGTGALVSEVVSLRIGDLDSKRHQLQLPGNRRTNERCVPINSDFYHHLRDFSLTGRNDGFSPAILFRTIDGRAVDTNHLCHIFKRLREAARVLGRDDRRRPPHMKDFRATFAVHRLVSWIKQGADLNRMIPALSTYMGYPELAATEKYLAFAPERFREQLNQLSPTKRKKHWRNDRELMSFLTGL